MDNKMSHSHQRNHRKNGYEWVMIHSHWDADVLLEHFYKTVANDIDDEIKEYWLRGAYDALLGLGIITPLGVKDVTKQVGCDRRTVTQAISMGYLTATRVGNSYIIHPLDLEQWLQSETKRKKA